MSRWELEGRVGGDLGEGRKVGGSSSSSSSSSSSGKEVAGAWVLIRSLKAS